MNSKIFILKISDIIELGCRFLVQYICREMLINAYEVFCPSVPVCIKIVDGGARRRRRAPRRRCWPVWRPPILANPWPGSSTRAQR